MRFSRATRPSPGWRALALFALLAAVASCGGGDGGPEGTLALSDDEVTFNGEVGGANPAAQTIAVTNAAGGSITDLGVSVNYGASQPTGWLSTSLSEDEAPSTLTLTPTTGVLAVGNYTAAVQVVGNNAGNGPQTVDVLFRVAGFAGSTTQGASSINVGANTLFGMPFTTVAPIVLASMNFYVTAPLTAGTQGRVAIFADAGGSPGALVASTEAQTVVIGRNEAVMSLGLPAGAYWLMVVFDNTTYLSYNAVAATNKFVSHTFGNAMPNPFPGTHSTIAGAQFSWFLKYYLP